MTFSDDATTLLRNSMNKYGFSHDHRRSRDFNAPEVLDEDPLHFGFLANEARMQQYGGTFAGTLSDDEVLRTQAEFAFVIEMIEGFNKDLISGP